MPDPAQAVHIPAGLPIDQATREELVQPGVANLYNRNVRFAQRNCLSKRRGFTALSSVRLDNTTRTAGRKLLAYGSQACVIDGHNIEVYDEVTGRWIVRDRVSECGQAQRAILPYPGGPPLIADSAMTSNGYLVAATVIQKGATLQMQVSIVNATTNAVVRTDVMQSVPGIAAALAVPTSGWIGVVTLGTSVIALYVENGAANTIKAQVLDASTPAAITTGWTGPVNVVTDRAGNLPFDTFTFSDRVALVYVNTSGGTDRLSVCTIDAAAAIITSTTVNTSSVTPTVCSCAGLEGDALWVSHNEAAANKVIGLDPTALTVTYTQANLVNQANQTQHGLVAKSAGHGTLFIANGPTGSAQIHADDFNISGGGSVQPDPAFNGDRAWPNVRPSSKPWRIDGHTYMAVAPQDSVAGGNTQFLMFVADVGEESTTLRPVANIAPRTSTISGLMQHVSLVSGAKYVLLNAVIRNSLSLGSTLGTTGASLEATYLDFGDTRRWQSQEYNGNLYIAGGVQSYFDEMLVREAGFLKRPDAPQLSQAAGAITDTSIRYVAVYEGIDSSGNVEWSAVSDPSATISPAAKDVTVTVACIAATSRYDTASPVNQIQIAIYRTTNAGLVFYRVGVVQNANTPTVTFLDQMTPATLITKAQLYKAPGVPGTAQDRFAPPGLYSVTAYNGMLLGVGDDGYTIWYSGQQVIGEGTWWNPIFAFPITDEGPITALAAMDGTLFVFKRSAIYVIQGSAPSGSGAQGGFGISSLISVNTGCRDERAMVVTSLGLFFLSDRGIELIIAGSQTATWIGEQVRNVVDAYPICTAATLDYVNERVYFEMAESETSNVVGGAGRTLVFNLTTRSWESVDDRVSETPAQSAAMVYYNGAHRYAWLSAAGVVYVENDASVLDAGAFPVASYEIPWVKFGLQQQQIAHGGMMLLEIGGARTGLKIEFANRYGDYDSSFDKVWTESTVAREVDFRPQQTNWAFKARISDIAPASPAANSELTFVGLSFDLTPEAQPTKATPHIAEAVRR